MCGSVVNPRCATTGNGERWYSVGSYRASYPTDRSNQDRAIEARLNPLSRTLCTFCELLTHTQARFACPSASRFSALCGMSCRPLGRRGHIFGILHAPPKRRCNATATDPLRRDHRGFRNGPVTGAVRAWPAIEHDPHDQRDTVFVVLVGAGLRKECTCHPPCCCFRRPACRRRGSAIVQCAGQDLARGARPGHLHRTIRSTDFRLCRCDFSNPCRRS